MYCQITLVGRVGRNPELRYTPTGMAVCNFTLAVTRRWHNKQTNETAEETTWWKIVVWGGNAENVNQYVEKGSLVLVAGDRMKTEAYKAQDGSLKSTPELTATVVKFLSSPNGHNSHDHAEYHRETPSTSIDDIPF